MSNSIIFISIVICLTLSISVQAAAVEPVVEELQTDLSNASTVTANEELATNEDCHQPKETGRCFALFYRFAYDVEKRECVEFIYGGCAGNSNNFESQEDCELKCMQKSKQGIDLTTVIAETSAATESNAPTVSASLPEAETEQAVAS